MKDINIWSLINSFKSLDKELYKKYLKLYKVSIKDNEIAELEDLINNILNIKEDMQLLSNYFVGYVIPQIGKEFDLLRFGKNYIINIELKRKSTKNEIKEQLIKNRYYLKFLKKDIYLFTYVREKNILYYLKGDNLEEVDFSFLIDKLSFQEVENIEDINSLFEPTNYLVSPFNTTDKFIKNEYFLTQQQKECKEKILKKITKNKQEANFFAVTGSAGTGKTLLTYDIAKTFIENNKKVLIIHCGILNEGQEELVDRYGWNIISVKDYKKYTISDYDLVIIDEVQRIKFDQLKQIAQTIYKNIQSCIFSYDKQQTLTFWEEKNDIDSKIRTISNIKLYKLSEKIRTNKDIANFIKMFFNKKRNNIELQNKNSVKITFFNSIEASKAYQKELQDDNYEVIKLTPSIYKNYHYEKLYINSITSHKVIGQEFDNVVIVLDNWFYYNKEGKLQYRGNAHYHPIKMLFQNLTRARKKIHIIIVDNQEVLNRCLEILSE